MTGTSHRCPIPSSHSTVSVSIIDTSVRFQQWDIGSFVEKPKIAGHNYWTAPSWAFKIMHPRHGVYLFDLGVRLDWETTLPTKSLNVIKQHDWQFKLDKDVAQILTENGENLSDVQGIFWSHWHWDHVGDPSKFPSSTKLVVGPGFKADILPGWPKDPEGRANADAWEGRPLEEAQIPQDGLRIGGYAALDYFGDGSFYLLDTPGHTVGHLCGVSINSWWPAFFPYVLYEDYNCETLISRTAGTNHFGKGIHVYFHGRRRRAPYVRPNSMLPLPDQIQPDPKQPIDKVDSFCPCDGYVAIHPQRSRDKPYYKGAKGMASDPTEAEKSTQKLESLDADDRVFTVIAHDTKLEEVIDVYPQTANDWHAKGWKQLAHWRFLGDFQPAQSTDTE